MTRQLLRKLSCFYKVNDLNHLLILTLTRVCTFVYALYRKYKWYCFNFERLKKDSEELDIYAKKLEKRGQLTSLPKNKKRKRICIETIKEINLNKKIIVDKIKIACIMFLRYMAGEYIMNIFILDHNPKIAAQSQCDKHVVKMIVESAQMLSTAHRMLDGVETKRPSVSGKTMINTKTRKSRNGIGVVQSLVHHKHPCTVWTMESVYNYNCNTMITFVLY